MTINHGILAITAALWLSASPLWGQGLTAQISGSLEDPTGAAVPGANLELLHTGTGQVRRASSSSTGTYVFVDLLPGTYSLVVVSSGFSTYEQNDIVLTSAERLALRPIRLALGEQAQSISVSAEAARLQTRSSERMGLITTSQLQVLSLKGRDYLGMLKLLPGVVDRANREGPSWSNMAVNINGGRQNTLNVTLDGVSNLDTGSMQGSWLAPSIDAIAEVKVFLSNYQAEYGRSSGGTINAVIKSGTKEFHGGAYYFKRNEALNANEFFRNRDGLARPRYRFDYPGYNIGGPVILPGINKNREKLFFFWSQEFLPRKSPTREGRLNFPTELERRGDFSQSLDTNLALIAVADPLNARRPFPGNQVPQSRIDRNGQGLLNLFPLPNRQDPGRTFNTVFQSTTENPRREEILRVDWSVGPRTLFYSRVIRNFEAFRGDFSFVLASNIWPQLPINYEIDSRGLVSTLIHTFSPTMVNEFTFGVNRGVQVTTPLNQEGLDRNDRVKLGLSLPQFYPENNPYNFIPNATFAGIVGAPQLFINNQNLFWGTNNVWNISDNVSKIMGQHNLKAGVYIEIASRNSLVSTQFNGTFNFGRNVNNPVDANHPFANALLGSINTYSETTGRPTMQGRYRNYEFFLQDNWRFGKRLTLDLGVRFYRIIPTFIEDRVMSTFDPSLYNAERAPRLVEPYRVTPTAARVGRNPLTGEVVPAVFIGTFAPGQPNLYAAMRQSFEKFFRTPPLQVAPRVGFALDVFGNGKTALRGGFGVFPDRFSDSRASFHMVQVPQVANNSAYYTTIPSLLTSLLVDSPNNIQSMQTDFSPPTVYNWSFGVQQDVGFGTVLDVAYVASVGRRLLQRRNLNAAPYGTNLLAGNIDSTLPGGQPLPPNFLRPIRGYGDILYNEFASSSNYHSLQAQANRRFTRRLTFGLTYTWSKALNLVDTDNEAVNPFLDFRMRNYGRASFDRLHNLVFSWDYLLPSPTGGTPLLRVLFNGWQLAGIASFISGQPTAIGYSFVQALDITGAIGAGPDSRVILTGNPNLPRAERTSERHFRTEVVAPPEAANFGIGNAPKDPIRGPGTNNWDISLFKNFPLSNDGQRRLQLRWETYNTFNHTQFNALDAAARFDGTGRQVNSRLGQYTGTSDARRMQLALKFYF